MHEQCVAVGLGTRDSTDADGIDGDVCDGDVLIRLHRLDAEFCNNCGLGLEELERVGIKTKSAEKLRED